MSASIVPFPGAALPSRDQVLGRGGKPKARVEIGKDCHFSCWGCDTETDLLMCWECGFFFCRLCLPHRAHANE